MRYTELIVKLAEETQYTPREMRAIVRKLTQLIQDDLAAGCDVQIDGLGTFKNVRQGVRSGRNAVTGARIYIAPTRRVLFRSCPGLRDRVHDSVSLFKEEDLPARFGLKEKTDGQVRSSGGPEEGPDRKEGGSR